MKKFLMFCLAVGCAFGDPIKIGTAVDYAPFNFEMDNEIVGFDIDLANELSKRLDFEIEFVKKDYYDICSAINEGELDIGISGFGNDPYTIDCFHSKSYYESELFFIKLANRYDLQSTSDLEGKSVAYDEDASSINKIIAKLNATPVAKKSESLMSLVFLLQEKKVDSIILDSINSVVLIDDYPYLDDKDKKIINDFKSLGGKISDFTIFHKQKATDSETFIIFPNNGRLDDLKQRIDTEITKMRADGTIEKMLKKYSL